MGGTIQSVLSPVKSIISQENTSITQNFPQFSLAEATPQLWLLLLVCL